MSAQSTSAEAKPDLQLEIAHILLIDVVGYSKLLVNEQIELVDELNQVVRSTDRFRRAEAGGKLIRLPTGDGMALLFFDSPEDPVQCALEISRALQSCPHIHLRMGIHSGPVNQVTDVNDRSNVAGAGINIVQRVMDCGDAGHILLSHHLAEDLAQYRHWRPHLHDLGECEVKHGLRIRIVNLYKDGLGNPNVPEKLKSRRRWSSRSNGSVRPITSPRWPQLVLIVALFFSVTALAVSFFIFFGKGAASFRKAVAPVSAVLAPPKGIAVLPFDDLSDAPNTFLSDGVQDEILTSLARVADLKVISRTSVMQYKGRAAARNLRDIAKELGVGHVVEGTVQRVGDRVRITAQLIDATTDTHLWADQYDRELADILGIQADVAQQVVSQLRAKLSPSEKVAIGERPTRSLVAYDLYLRARVLIDDIAFATNAREKLFEATRLLDEALKHDPSFLLAAYHLARAHDHIYFLAIDHTPRRLELAEAAVQTALRLRPESGEAHLALAQHLYWGYRDYDRASKELALARSKLPNEPLALLLQGYIDRRQGRWTDSIRQMERALELDPRNLFILQQVSFTYEQLRRFKDMAAVLDRILSITPNDVTTRAQRATVELQSHADIGPLHRTIESILAETPSSAMALSHHARFLALCERDAGAARRSLVAMRPEGDEDEGFSYPKAFFEGVVARVFGDQKSAEAAFRTARQQIVKSLSEQPDYPQLLSVLGIIDAGLNNKDDAIREAKRACELLPIAQDAMAGTIMIENLALVYCWTGEKALACQQLDIVTRVPSGVNYGQLRLHPLWDPLRGEPCFEKIVASLAPSD